jgi:vacuolar-type H+-ATPase subunit I/STV1
MSSHQDRADALKLRVDAINAQVNDLSVERHLNALSAVNGDKEALRTIARIDTQIDALLKERATVASASEQIEKLIATEAAEAEQRALHARQVEAHKHASAICALHTAIDQELNALRQLFERRAEQLAHLARTEAVNSMVLAKLGSKGGATAAAQAAGLHKYIELHQVPAVATRPLADCNAVLIGIGPKQEVHE